MKRELLEGLTRKRKAGRSGARVYRIILWRLNDTMYGNTSSKVE
jgi:hypothetical protein